MKTIVTFMLIALVLGVVVVEAKNAVRLQDVSVLTFTKGEYTEGRRRSGIEQLRCVGGGAKGQYEPYTAMCKNLGFDGRDVAWKCEADLPAEFTLGKVTVSCEGFDYPEDSYVLKDSCALEYNLEYSEVGKQTGYHPEKYSTISQQNTIVRNRGFFGNIFFTLRNIIMGLITLPFTILRWIFSFFYRGTTTFLKLLTAGIALMVGLSVFRGITSAKNQKHYTQSAGRVPYSAKAAPGGLAGGSEERGSGAGFWSGVLSGGLVSYFLSRRKNNQQTTSAGAPSPRQYNQQQAYNSANFNASSGGAPYPAPVPEEHHSEAYGKTERR